MNHHLIAGAIVIGICLAGCGASLGTQDQPPSGNPRPDVVVADTRDNANDSYRPPADTGTPILDTGTAPIDTGTAIRDTGTIVRDAGMDTGVCHIECTAPGFLRCGGFADYISCSWYASAGCYILYGDSCPMGQRCEPDVGCVPR